MLTFRVALSNSTNSPCPSSRPTSTRFVAKPSTSRKSAPTCTVSLANAGANDSLASLTSVGPSATHSHINLIPFPSSSEPSDLPISQPDRTCLLLLRESSGVPLHTRTRASSILPSPQERRKRSTVRLLQPAPFATAVQAKSGAELPCQPPRKRPRLNKDTRQVKPTSLIGSSDLQFMGVVQRSVAGGVVNRRTDTHTGSADRFRRSNVFEAQDELLASRLRSYLLLQGFSDADLITTHIEPQINSSAMDMDVEMRSPSVVSVDMDVDVESPEGGNAHSASRPSPSLYRSVSPLGPDRLGTSQLVATLIMRRRTQKPSRCSTFRSDRIGSERRISPLVT